MHIGQRAWSLMQELTELRSISTTPGEGVIARRVHEILSAHPYYKEHPEYLKLTPIEGAPGNPAVVTALFKGNGNRAVMFMNHHDIVDVEDYGIYKDLACSPMELTKKLKPSDLPENARQDLESGEWIFGRGTMDMLYGLAIQLAFMEKYATDPHSFDGSLLFVSVPDEENNSLGMRHAIGEIREFQDSYNLDFVATVNSEPHDITKGANVIQTGSDGKLLPLFCCFGKETHASSIYSGLNAHLMLAEVIRLLELNPGFCDQAAGEQSMPPTVLRAGDLKGVYNVSTPGTAYAFFNVFTLQATPQEIMTKLDRLAHQAFINAMDKYKRSAEYWTNFSGQETSPAWEPHVLTFKELWTLCHEAHGQAFIDKVEEKTQLLKDQGLDLQRLTLELVNYIHDFCPNREPKIVIALAPPYYPAVRNLRETKKELACLEAIQELQDFSQRELGLKLDTEEFHRGISDLSYCMLQNADKVIDTVRDNCPAWDRAYHLPLEEMAKLDAPAVNLGPLGRDPHKFTERIHISFAQETLPILMEKFLEDIVKP